MPNSIKLAPHGVTVHSERLRYGALVAAVVQKQCHQKLPAKLIDSLCVGNACSTELRNKGLQIHISICLLRTLKCFDTRT